MSTTTSPDWLERQDTERAAALAEFRQWREFLELAEWGRAVGAFCRVRRAVAAVREWRRVANQPRDDDELLRVAIRVAADSFASQIEAAAVADAQDPVTVAWVTAGLRCPARPFCTGCTSCQTVTSPSRPCA